MFYPIKPFTVTMPHQPKTLLRGGNNPLEKFEQEILTRAAQEIETPTAARNLDPEALLKIAEQALHPPAVEPTTIPVQSKEVKD